MISPDSQPSELERISHFYSDDKLTYASTDTRQYIVDYSLQMLEQVLFDKGFLRIHRSTLVNLAFVEELHRWFGGRMIVRIKATRSNSPSLEATSDC